MQARLTWQGWQGWQGWQAQSSAWGGAVEAGDPLGKRLALAGGIALGVAAARLGAVAEGTFSGGYLDLLKLLFQGARKLS